MQGYQANLIVSMYLSLAGEEGQDQGPASRLRTRSLLGAPGIATRSKDATRGSWTYY